MGCRGVVWFCGQYYNGLRKERIGKGADRATNGLGKERIGKQTDCDREGLSPVRTLSVCHMASDRAGCSASLELTQVYHNAGKRTNVRLATGVFYYWGKPRFSGLQLMCLM